MATVERDYRAETEARIPGSTLETLREYIERGTQTGGFLYAVLTNDLLGSFERADLRNRAALFDIVTWLYNYAPAACWRTAQAVIEWEAEGGLAGRRARAEAEAATS